MPISLRARFVFCVDRPPIDGGVVTIDGERIVAVEATPQIGETVCDLGDVALVPGLVNAHTHLEFSHLREPLGRPGMPLAEWLSLAIAERHSRGPAAALSIACGIQESVLAGTCAIGEIATAEVGAYSDDSTVDLTGFLEVIGFSRARTASAFAAVEERLAAAHGLLKHIGLSPHAPYTVSPELVSKLVQVARQRNMPVAMHLAECAEELELLAAGTGPFRELLEERSMWDPAAIPLGSRPLDYLRLLANAPRALVVHGNYLDRAEHDFLAANADRMSLVYCPRTHAYFDHFQYPLAELLAAGVKVALGTDSRASSPDLGMLGEMQHVVQTHTLVPPESILRMATLDSARALGRADDCGSITPGKLANLAAIPMRTGSLAEALAASEKPAAIWLRGREV